MKRLLVLLLFAAPLAAQTPVTTCNKTPPSVDQLCVTLTNGLGYDQVFAGNIADFLQAGAVASAVQVALLNAVRNQETADIKNAQVQIDALTATATAHSDLLAAAKIQEAADIKAVQTQISNIPAGPPGPQGVPGQGGVACSQLAPKGYYLHAAFPAIIGSTTHATFLASPGASMGFKLQFGSVGTRYDYLVCVPSAGPYMLSLRTNYETLNTGVYSLHLETNGLNLSGSVKMAAETNAASWAVDTAPVTFTSAGLQVVTIVVDSIGTARFHGDYFELIKQ